MAAGLTEAASSGRRRRLARRVSLGRLGRRLEACLPASAGAAVGAPLSLPSGLERALAEAGGGAPVEAWRFDVAMVELSFEALVGEAELRRALAGQDLWLFVPTPLPLIRRWGRALRRLAAPAPVREARRLSTILIRTAPGAPAQILVDGTPLIPTEGARE